jgi:hypothetical protein
MVSEGALKIKKIKYTGKAVILKRLDEHQSKGFDNFEKTNYL